METRDRSVGGIAEQMVNLIGTAGGKQRSALTLCLPSQSKRARRMALDASAVGIAIAELFVGVAAWTIDDGEICHRAAVVGYVRSKPSSATAPTRMPATAKGRADRSAALLSLVILLSSLAVGAGSGNRRAWRRFRAWRMVRLCSMANES